MESYQNAMAVLVEQEVERQIRDLNPRLAARLNKLQLIAYALNQLPGLYATSQKGLKHQLERGKKEYQEQITAAVRRAFAAIQRDPLRSHPPLVSPDESEAHREALRQLRLLLKNEKLEWSTLAVAVETAIANKTLKGPLPSYRAAASRASVESKQFDLPQKAIGSYGSWENPLYKS